MDKKEILKWISIVVLVFAAIYFVLSVSGVTGNVVSDDSAYIESGEVIAEVYSESSPIGGVNWMLEDPINS